ACTSGALIARLSLIAIFVPGAPEQGDDAAMLPAFTKQGWKVPTLPAVPPPLPPPVLPPPPAPGFTLPGGRITGLPTPPITLPGVAPLPLFQWYVMISVTLTGTGVISIG